MDTWRIETGALHLHLYFLHLYSKIPKIYLSFHTISMRSHFRKWLWRDWQPLYHIGCKVLICLCRYEWFACSLLLDWYLGSQKLREILTLLCCITLSSSRKTNTSSRRSKKDFWRRCRGGLCRCQNWRMSGRGARTVRLRLMVTRGRGHDVLPRFGPSRWR